MHGMALGGCIYMVVLIETCWLGFKILVFLILNKGG